MSLVEVAATGDRRATLEELRAVAAASILDADPDKRAPLMKQLRETLSELDSLPSGKEESASDSLASKRAARRAAAQAAASA